MPPPRHPRRPRLGRALPYADRVNGWLLLACVGGVVLLCYLAAHFGWVDLTNKSRRGGGSGLMGIGDEAFNPTRHEAQIELDRQTVLPAPAPLPGDGDFGIYGGDVRIDLRDVAERDAADVRAAAERAADERAADERAAENSSADGAARRD
jgi:hypothetical protein